MSIQTKALLVTLTAGIWAGQRLDKSASEKVTRDAHAESDAARVNKHLIPKAALAPVMRAYNALRAHHHNNTLPWAEAGRLLPTAHYADFLSEHKTLVDKFYAEVDAFVDNAYLAEVQRAQFRMGALFDLTDYPDADDLRRRFHARLSVYPVPNGNDFRVDMSEAEVDDLRRDLNALTTARVAEAMDALRDKLGAMLSHLASKLEDEDSIWRDTTLTNVQELVTILHRFNVTNDPTIAQAADDLTHIVTGLQPSDLRKNVSARKATTSAVRDVLTLLGMS